MSQEQFWVLFSKKLSGEASAEELAFLESMIQSHPEISLSLNYGIAGLTELMNIVNPQRIHQLVKTR